MKDDFDPEDTMPDIEDFETTEFALTFRLLEAESTLRHCLKMANELGLIATAVRCGRALYELGNKGIVQSDDNDTAHVEKGDWRPISY